MGDVCLMRAVLVGDAFEAKLGRGLTAGERQAIHDVASRAGLEWIERRLEEAGDAGAAEALLAGVCERRD